jgi:hypothetical protein
LTACNESGTAENEKRKMETILLNQEDSIIDSQSWQLFNRLDSVVKTDSSQKDILRLFYDKSMVVFQRTKKLTRDINSIINKYDSTTTYDIISAEKDGHAICDSFKDYLSVICTYSQHDAQKTLDSLIQITKHSLVNENKNQTKEDFVNNLSKLKVASKQAQKLMIELILADWDSKPAMSIIIRQPNGKTDTIHWTKEDYK